MVVFTHIKNSFQRSGIGNDTKHTTYTRPDNHQAIKPVESTESPVDKLRRMLQTSDLSPDTEKVLAEVWAQVEEYMRELFGKEFKDKDISQMDIRELVSMTSFPKGYDQSSLIGAVTGFCNAVNTAGNLVAQGASTVFSPATPCFAGIALLLSGVKVYAGITVQLEQLLRNCMTGLENMCYMRHIGPPFAKKVQKYLSLFLSICCEWDKIRKSHTERLKAVFKSTFLDDSVVRTFTMELDELRKDRNDSALYQVLDATAQPKQYQDYLRIIADGLSFNPGDLDHNGEPEGRCLGQAYKDPFDGTGSWIQYLDEYKAWREGTHPVLLLTGNTGEGKTFAMANEVKRLLQQGELVLFYFENDMSTVDTDNEGVLSRMMRSIIWQCARKNFSLASSMAGLIQGRKFMKSLDLWKELLLENETRRSNEIKLYILIDTLSAARGNDPWFPLLQSLMTLSQSDQIRFFMTSNQERYQYLLERGLTFNSIHAPLHSQTDIDIYANVRMDQMKSLSDISNGWVVNYRNNIVAKLRSKCRGNWTKVITVLDLIERKSRSPAQISEALRTLDDGAETSIRNLLRQLERDLIDDEINEVNTIINWITYGQRPLTCKELDAALWSKWHTPWFQDLPSRIKEYSIFDIDEFERVTWRSLEIERHILGQGFADTSQGDAVLKAEIEIVTHGLRNICPDTLFNRLEFEPFLESKLQRPMARNQYKFHVDRDNANLDLVSACLSSLIDGPRRGPLVQYAGLSLLRHLEGTDLHRANPSWKAAVKRSLATLFTKRRAMDTLFCSPEKVANESTWPNGQGIGEGRWLDSIREDWLYSDRGCNQLSRWFKDGPVATEGLSDQARQIVVAFSNDQENRRDLLFATALESVSHGIVFSAGSIMSMFITTYFFLVGFRARLSGCEARSCYHPKPSILLLDDLRQLEPRMMNAYKDQYSTLLPSFYCSMGLIFSFAGAATPGLGKALKMGFKNESVARILKAQELAPNDTMKLFFSAAVYEKDPEKLVLFLEELVKEFDNNDRTEFKEGQQEFHQLALIALAHNYWDKGPDRRETAKRYYLNSVEKLFSISRVYISIILKQYIATQEWPGLIAIINKICLSLPNWDSTCIGSLIQAVTKPKFWLDASQMALKTQDISSICDLYDALLDFSRRIQDRTASFLLMRTSGLVLMMWMEQVGNPDVSDKAIQLLEEALDIPTPSRGDFNFYTVTGFEVREVISALALLYFRQDNKSKPAHGLSECGRKLEKLAEDHDITQAGTAANVLAAYYMRLGKQSKAKKVQEVTVLRCLEMLSDNNPSNDMEALQGLALAISCLHDDETLVSIVKVLVLIEKGWWIEAAALEDRGVNKVSKVVNTSDSTQDSEIQPPKPTQDHKDYTCDKCQQPKFVSSGICIAADVRRIDIWDIDCYKNLQRSPSDLDSCWKEWRFIEVRNWEITKIPNTFIPVGSDLIPLKEWKKRLRDTWCNDRAEVY